ISNNSHWGVFLAYAKSFIVTNCEIKYNHMGVAIWPCDSSTVKNCNISNNNYGVYIPSGEWIGGWRYNYSNMIYHNNFVDNTVQAYDAENNIWDNGYPSGGNYWSDYNGSDNDGDGIGDTPYYVPGGSSRDRYPLMQPWNGSLPTPDISFVADDVDDTITVTSISPAGVSWSNVRVECYNDSNQSAVIPMNGTIEAGDVIDVKKAGLYGNVTVRITWLPTNTLLAEFNLYIQPLHPDVEIEKYVKDKVTGEWVNYENVTIGDIATFKLKITNTGDTLLTICQVLDYLPHGLEYQGTTDTPPDYPIEWVFNDVPPGESVYVVFTAEATTVGEKINLARVIAVDENQNTMQDEDTAIVYVAQPPQPNVSIEKYVRSQESSVWQKHVNVSLGDQVHFKLVCSNIGNVPLENFSVIDYLPTGLTYADNATPKEPDYIDGNKLYWNFRNIYPGATITVEFTAVAESTGEHRNIAYVYTPVSSGEIVYSNDTATVNVFIQDTTPPNTTIKLSGTKGNNGWYVSDVVVTLNAVDDASGVSHTFYRLFHIKTPGILQWQEYTGPFMVTNEGRFTLEFYSVDNAGNVEKIKSAKFKIDKTPPETTHHIRKLGRKTIVSLEAFDGVSGVDRTFYSVDGGRFRVYRCPFFLSSGVQHQVRYYSVDQAGNREPVKVIVIEDNPVSIPPPPWVIPP
ncbi:MAG TPA: DUF11 domain-containing protein, partial [Thermoplasmatales archaeon]|nr:DUF11 domain-containing protein [Thermoplasmatales archaeon]